MWSRNEINPDAPRPSRRSYSWEDLEEYGHDGGMWRTPPARERDALADAAADLMRNEEAFACAMRRALIEWPVSCSVALTTPGLNRRAWLGHAGCYLETGSPEETTRLGWHRLEPHEQARADAAADLIIAEWAEGQEQPSLFGGGEDA